MNSKHSFATVELNPGETFDARGSLYREGVTKWTAAGCQSWAKFSYDGEKFVALNFEGKEIPTPHWCKLLSENECLEGDECKAVTA